MRFIWWISIVLEILLTSSENYGNCFFSLTRQSPLEQFERKEGMKVSSGEKCTGKMISLNQLLIKKPSKEYHGAFHDLDLSLTRGAGHYMENANDMTGIPSNIEVCEGHLKELATHWESFSYKHLIFDKKKGERILSCSWPEGHDRKHHIQRRGEAHYLSRIEAKNYLVATGIHVHIGLALCKDHYDRVINAINEEKDEQCDPTFEMEVDREDNDEKEDEEEETKETSLQRAFFSFCKEAGIDRTCPRKSFIDYEKETQTRKVRTVEKIVKRAADIIAPGWQNELLNRLRFNGENTWEQLLHEKMGGMIIEIKRHYLLAEDPRTRHIILSQAAGSLTYPEILPYFSGLSSYKYNVARKIALSVTLPPQITITRERITEFMIEEYVHYIASPHNFVHLPTGYRTATLSSGEVLDIPDVVRIHGQTELIRGYKKYLAENDKTHLLMSDSSLIRIWNALPATKRHSMTCVDTYKANSYYAYEDISKMLEELKDMAIIGVEEMNSKKFDFLEIRHYFKTDYPLHVKMDSRVADHSMIFALSDPDNKAFYAEPEHPHDLQCPRCSHHVSAFRAMEDLLTTAYLNSQENAKRISEMIFRLTGHKETIFELKSHEMRSMYTDLEREHLIESAEEGEGVMTADYGQKVIPCKHYEDQISYFAKRGMSWHFLHVVARVGGVYVTHAFVHVMNNDNKQTSQSVTTTIEMALKGLSIMGIHTVHIRSDNAAYYHCAGTIGSMPSLSKSTGVTVKSWSFSEVSNGKGSADRVTANCKSKTRRLINSGRDMENQNDLISLLEAAPMLKGLSFYLFDLFDSPTPQTPSKIPRITDYSHFEYEEDGVRAWKYRGIGEGILFKDDLHSNTLPYEIKRSGGYLPNADSAAWDLHRIRNRQTATFWHYDPKNIASREVQPVSVDESTVDSESATTTEGRDGLLFTCWCGASYVRHGDLLNHLDFGKHQSHPWKMTSIDLSLNYYKRCLENTVQVKSLIPLQDFIEKIFDNSIPPLQMGWALRGAKKNTPLPEKTKKFIHDFFLEKTKIGKRAEAEEAYLKMVSDPAIPMEERLTKEQIKRYINRLVATPVKKKVVVRGRRSVDIEMDEDGDAIEWKIEERDDVGEWEMEPGCEDEEEGQMTLADEYSEYIRKNKKTILPGSF